MRYFDVYPRFDIILERAEDVYVFDQNGLKYLDLYGGHGVISIGHSHFHYKEKLANQIEKIGFYSNSIQIPEQEEFARKLSRLSGYVNHKLFMCNSGAEANENAIKLASFHTNRKKLIAFKNSFHGRTGVALNVTDDPQISAPINQDNFPVEFIELNNEIHIEKALKQNDVCAIIIEGIQGVGGLDLPSVEFLKFLSKKSKQYGALLILDEIQSGYGRSGKFFAHQYADIEADIVSMAKGMGNGFPIAGILIHSNIRSSHGMLGTTFGGNHLACAAGQAVLDIIETEKLIQNTQQVNKEMVHQLNKNTRIKKVKGMGLMLGIELDGAVKDLRRQLFFEYQIITGSSKNPNVLRILPPLCISYEQTLPFIEALKELLA